MQLFTVRVLLFFFKHKVKLFHQIAIIGFNNNVPTGPLIMKKKQISSYMGLND